jgi:hypothetical protein
MLGARLRRDRDDRDGRDAVLRRWTFISFSIATTIVVAVAMIGSLTVLPARLPK